MNVRRAMGFFGDGAVAGMQEHVETMDAVSQFSVMSLVCVGIGYKLYKTDPKAGAAVMVGAALATPTLVITLPTGLAMLACLSLGAPGALLAGGIEGVWEGYHPRRP